MHPENIFPYLKRGHSLAFQTRDDDIAYGWIALQHRPANQRLATLCKDDAFISAQEAAHAARPFRVGMMELKALTWEQEDYHGPDDLLRNEWVSFATLDQVAAFLAKRGIALTDLVEAHRIKTG